MNDDFKPVKQLLGPIGKGGMRIGRPGAIDGIELELLRLTKAPPTAQQAGRSAADWQRMGAVLCAVAEVTPFYIPSDVKSPGRRKRWNDFAGDMGDAARELIKAAKANDAKSLGAVAVRLARSCSDCHAHFREGGAVHCWTWCRRPPWLTSRTNSKCSARPGTLLVAGPISSA